MGECEIQTADLYVSYPHLPLHVVAHYKVSQNAAGGDLGLLHNVWLEGDLADVLVLFDHRGNRGCGISWWAGEGGCENK